MVNLFFNIKVKQNSSSIKTKNLGIDLIKMYISLKLVRHKNDSYYNKRYWK